MFRRAALKQRSIKDCSSEFIRCCYFGFESVMGFEVSAPLEICFWLHLLETVGLDHLAHGATLCFYLSAKVLLFLDFVG